MTLSRLMGEHKRIRLETDRSVYWVNDQCRLYAHLLDDNYQPIVQPAFEVYVSNIEEGQQKEMVRLQPDRSQSGLYEGYFSPSTAGRYRLEANESDQELSNTTEFQVSDVRQELLDTNMRKDQLQRIADLTGGTKLGIPQLPELPGLVNGDPVTLTLRSERPLWDNLLVAFVLVALLGAEWIFRRRYDLP